MFINDDALKHIGECRNLRILSITQTSITSKGVFHLSNLTKLNSLNLSQSPEISDWSFLQYFKSLTSLKINQTNINDNDKALYLPMLRNLELLGLADTALQRDLTFLQSLPNLTSLYLQGNRIVDGNALMVLSNMPRLLSLSLQSCDGLDHLLFIDPVKLPLLAHLDLSHCRGLKEKDLARLDQMKNLQRLRIPLLIGRGLFNHLKKSLNWTIVELV